MLSKHYGKARKLRGKYGRMALIAENMNNFFKGKKILITGNTGFKGSWLTEILLQWGADIVGVSLPPKTEPNLFAILNLEQRIKNYFLDIRDFDALKKVIADERPEIV